MAILVSIGVVAEFFGVTAQTIRNWTEQGLLKNAQRTLGGHRRYDLEEVQSVKGEAAHDNGKKTVIYSRVSSYDQKEDLERQAEELERHCREQNLPNIEIVKDIGSGINYKKKGLKKLIREIILDKVKRIIVSYKDRLLRFGNEILFQICRIKNVEITILHEKANKKFEQELVEDVLAILTVYSAKIYGHRSHKKVMTG